jgi:hypothetical protein
VKRKKQRGSGIVPMHRKMIDQRAIIKMTARTKTPFKPLRKMARRSGVLRMISPPRAFSAGYGF